MLPPLKLTNFERFVYFDDRPEYPWHVIVRLIFNGELNINAIEAANLVVLERHTLLSSHINKNGAKLSWQFAEPATVKEAAKCFFTEQEYPVLQFLNLIEEIGFRTYLHKSEEKSILTFQMHHCCVDGKGALEVVRDWLIAYHNFSSQTEYQADLITLNTQKLRKRNSFGRNFWQRIQMIPSQSVGLFGAREFISHKPVPMINSLTSNNTEKPNSHYPSVLVHQFNAQDTESIKQISRAESCTINDLLIFSTHQAIHKWRFAKGETDQQEWIRLMVPINLRSDFENDMPASNVVGSVFIDRKGCEMEHQSILLKSISTQMNLIKRHQLGFAFLWSLWLQNLIPGSLERTANSEACVNSATLTNFGPVLEGHPLISDEGLIMAGDCELLSVDVSGPIRPKNHTTFAVCTYAKQLSISLHYNSQKLSEDDAQDLLNLVIQQLMDMPDS